MKEMLDFILSGAMTARDHWWEFNMPPTSKRMYEMAYYYFAVGAQAEAAGLTIRRANPEKA
jgi:hypothetical protein